MVRISAFLVTLFLALGNATVARSGTLEWMGSLTLEIGTVWPVTSTGAGVATVNGSSGGGYLTSLRLAGGITPSTPTMIWVTDAWYPTSPDTIMVRAGIRTGTLAPFAGGGPLTQNAMPLSGTYKICLFLAGCGAWVDIPFTDDGTRGLGIGGLVTVNGFGAGLKLSVWGAPWTIGNAAATGVFTTNAMIPPRDRVETGTVSAAGFAHGPISGTSTASMSGVIQLVTAGRVESTLDRPLFDPGVTAALELVVVPEPGLLLLLASGVGGLTLLGRRRLRR
jgi:hypothetical protein